MDSLIMKRKFPNASFPQNKRVAEDVTSSRCRTASLRIHELTFKLVGTSVIGFTKEEI